MSIIQSIILGVVQGIGEFLPISSSAHLILVPYLFGWKESSLAFDVALHFGTLLAVLVIFFKEWWDLFIGAIKNIGKSKKSNEGKMFWYLIVATIPAALVGFLLNDIIEGFFRNQIWFDVNYGENIFVKILRPKFILIDMGLRALIQGKISNLRVLMRAYKDGMNNNLGKTIEPGIQGKDF